MQADLDVVDWHELKKFKDTDEFAEWRVDLDEDPDWILSGEDLAWGNDSYSTYFAIAEGLVEIAPYLRPEERELLAKSYLILFAAAEEYVIEDFPCMADSCYFFALSPDRVASILEASQKLDREFIITNLVDVVKEMDSESVSTFFDQVDNVVRIAAEKKWGILGFAG